MPLKKTDPCCPVGPDWDTSKLWIKFKVFAKSIRLYFSIWFFVIEILGVILSPILLEFVMFDLDIITQGVSFSHWQSFSAANNILLNNN